VVNLLAALRGAVYARHPGALRVAVNGPITFDTSVKQVIQLLEGHCLEIIPEPLRRDGEALCGYLRERAVDVLDCTPTQLHLLLAGGLVRDPTSVRCVLVGGEAIDPALWQVLAGSSIEFVNVYGPTECTVDATACRIERGQPRPSLGHPLANVRTYVLDRDRQLVPVGVPGELYIGGAGVARGYLGDPEATAERFLDDPFDRTPGARMYRTGDRVRCHGDGSLEFLGRLDHQIKLRGFRVDPGEIEAAVMRQPGVQACAVQLVATGETGDPRLVAYVAPAEACAAALPRALRASLPEYMVPAAFVGLAALPVTPNGKLDRAALPPPTAAALTAMDDHVAPRTPSETLLAEIWAELLYGDPARASSISVTASFFHLGGSSLLAVRMLHDIERRLGQNLHIQELLEDPTIEHLAEVVRRLNTWEGVVQRYDGAIGTPDDREHKVRRKLLVTVRDRGKHPPMFYVPGLTGIYPSTLMVGVLNLVEHLDPELPFYGLQTPALAPELANAGRQAVASWCYDRESFDRLADEAVARIEEVLPAGPISLVAFCSGNRLTLEIARRWRARGRRLHAHVMLDPTIDLPEEKPAQNTGALANLDRPLAEITWYITHTIGWRAGWDPIALYHTLHALPPDQRWQCARDKLVETGQVPAHVTAQALRHVFELRITERAILRRLVDSLPPGHDDGPVTLLFTEQLRARASDQRVEEALRYMRTYLSGALEVRVTRGDHITAFHEPNVRSLAAELNRVLVG
jgi:thioesterase domain-containing protein